MATKKYASLDALAHFAARLKELLSAKQDALTAGDNITIDDGVISATGGTEVNVVSPLYGSSPALANEAVYATALGYGSDAIGYDSVAIGAGSQATESGVVSVGTGKASSSRSNGWRRIVNVGDPVNDTDAATKAYVDSCSSDYELPAATSTTLGGVKVGSGLKVSAGVLSLALEDGDGVSY